MWNDSSMEVYDGDCYPGIFNYCAAHAWYEPNMCCIQALTPDIDTIYKIKRL